MDRIVVHTNFTNTAARRPRRSRSTTSASRAASRSCARVFFDPEKLARRDQRGHHRRRPPSGSREIAEALRDARPRRRTTVAHFLDRIVFCLFAEDVGLLPDEALHAHRSRSAAATRERFAELARPAVRRHGRRRRLRRGEHPPLQRQPVRRRRRSSSCTAERDRAHRSRPRRLDWSAVEPAIFGTLFERGLDPAKRAQLGAHYTSREDIETLVEPVVMQPLRREWAETAQPSSRACWRPARSTRRGGEKPPTGAALEQGPRRGRQHPRTRFLDRLGAVKVLDPACGSGNFLYVTLQKLKDLEKEVIVFADATTASAASCPWSARGSSTASRSTPTPTTSPR